MASVGGGVVAHEVVGADATDAGEQRAHLGGVGGMARGGGDAPDVAVALALDGDRLAARAGEDELLHLRVVERDHRLVAEVFQLLLDAGLQCAADEVHGLLVAPLGVSGGSHLRGLPHLQRRELAALLEAELHRRLGRRETVRRELVADVLEGARHLRLVDRGEQVVDGGIVGVGLDRLHDAPVILGGALERDRAVGVFERDRRDLVLVDGQEALLLGLTLLTRELDPVDVGAEGREDEEDEDGVPRPHFVLRRHHTVRPRRSSSSGMISTER